MGRPLKSSFFGTAGGANLGIRLLAWVPATGTAGNISGNGTSAVDSFIVRQVGSKKYVVSNAQGVGKIQLVESGTPAIGEAYMEGLVGGVTPVAIKKLTAKVAFDFDDNRYTWALENDSSADYIVLTAL